MNANENYIIFELAGFAYGVRSDDVMHVDLLEHVTPVPNAHPAVQGVVFSRGQVIPALNLRSRFGLPPEVASARSRLIFLKWSGRTVALIVDAAREFCTIPAASIRPIEETLTGIDGNYLRGVAQFKDRMVLLLDLATVLDLSNIELPAETSGNATSSA